jgi:hypothetical protein
MRTTFKTLAALLLASTPALALVPTITSATATQTPNTLNYLIDVHGTNFVLNNPGTSIVYINGTAQTTTFVSSTEIKVLVYAAAKGATSVSAQVKQAGGNSNTEGVTVPFSKAKVTGLVTMGEGDNADSNPYDYSMNQLCDFGSGWAAVPCSTNGDPVPWATAVVSVGWDQLQPDSENETINTTAIENALSSIASFNAKHGTNITGKLRIFAGTHAPTWTTDGTGGAWNQGVVLAYDSKGDTATFPEFWTSQYHTAWLDMISQVAAIYDDDPRIQEVAVTSCSSRTGEPFIYSTDSTSEANLQSTSLQTPFTDTLMQGCLTTAYTTDYSTTYWKYTPIDFTMNPYVCITGGTSCGTSGLTSVDWSLKLMNDFHNALGTQAVVANHDIEDPPPGGTKIYFGDTSGTYTGGNGYGIQAEGVKGAPIEFQSYAPKPAGANSHGSDWQITMLYSFCQFAVTEFEMFPSTRVTFTDMSNGGADYNTGSPYNSGTNPDGLSDWAGWMAAGIPASIPSGQCSWY